jgi:hypothetical protein
MSFDSVKNSFGQFCISFILNAWKQLLAFASLNVLRFNITNHLWLSRVLTRTCWPELSFCLYTHTLSLVTGMSPCCFVQVSCVCKGSTMPVFLTPRKVEPFTMAGGVLLLWMEDSCEYTRLNAQSRPCVKWYEVRCTRMSLIWIAFHVLNKSTVRVANLLSIYFLFF